MAHPLETQLTTAGDVDIAYQVVGERSLKGVPGQWHLFAVENY